MQVSVIIPTYNEEKAIGECLASLSRQSFKDLEIILVDDGSTDGTISKIKNQRSKIQKSNPLRGKNLKILIQKHKGAGSARNLGAKKARGEILVFVDADMTFDKNFIEKLIEPIIRGETIGTFSKDEYLANKKNVWATCWNINRGLPPIKMLPDNYPDKQKVFRAILAREFEKAGGFDEKAGYTDDWSLSEKLGVEATSAPGAIFYHKNPETLYEVFIQSRWMAKRKYKLGIVGDVAALIRVSFPASFVVGTVLAAVYLLPAFFIFKIISDFGQFIGILEYVFYGKIEK